MSPISLGRYDQELWQAYVKANKVGPAHRHSMVWWWCMHCCAVMYSCAELVLHTARCFH
jgi:hypothetical protein